MTKHLEYSSDGRQLVPFSKYRGWKSFFAVKKDTTIYPIFETLLRRITDTEKRNEYRKELKKYYGLLSQHRVLKEKFEIRNLCDTHSWEEHLSEVNYIIKDSKDNIDKISKEIRQFLGIDEEEFKKIILEIERKKS